MEHQTMKKLSTLHWILIIIGFLSLVSGAYLALSGGTFSSYFSGIFIGTSLIGATIIQANEVVSLSPQNESNCSNPDNTI